MRNVELVVIDRLKPSPYFRQFDKVAAVQRTAVGPKSLLGTGGECREGRNFAVDDVLLLVVSSEATWDDSA